MPNPGPFRGRNGAVPRSIPLKSKLLWLAALAVLPLLMAFRWPWTGAGDSERIELSGSVEAREVRKLASEDQLSQTQLRHNFAIWRGGGVARRLWKPAPCGWIWSIGSRLRWIIPMAR